jgi:signal transduction histidine kinase
MGSPPRQQELRQLAQIGVLSSGLAHEVRNYLNAMQAQIALLRKLAGPDAVEIQGRIEKLERNVASLEQFLTDFLSFARPQKNRLEESDPVTLVREVMEFVQLGMERAGVEMRLEATQTLPLVSVDKGKLKRAILNLMINARQAMPGGGRLTLRLWPGWGNVCIEVEDTGCGIPAEVQHRVFETFFSTKSEGSGLGLAVVRRTVEDMGGTVRFHSELGRGTTFSLVLPTAARSRSSLVRRQGGSPSSSARLPLSASRA